jgi:pimeloyl-ACP methyl ester carboxylesterase/DNA-binding CsgD family transcriptional regulator
MEAPPPARYARTSDGYDIAYFVAGEGLTMVRPPVAWNHISRQWTPEMLGPTYGALAAHFRLVLFDGRGQGLSTRGLPESLSFDDLVLDLEAVIEQLNQERIIVFGMSFAASLAIEYAVAHPDRVIGLILWNYQDYQARSDAMIRLAQDDWNYHVASTVRVGFSGFDPDLSIEIARDSTSQMDHIRRLRALRSVSGQDLLAGVTVPTLMLAHRAGVRRVAGEPSHRAAAIVPDSRLVLFDDPGTLGKVENGIPEGVSAILDFVASIEVPEGRLINRLNKRHSQDAMPSLAHFTGDNTVTGLTSREQEVLALLANGQSNKQIALRLSLSLSTVNHHVSNIYAKIEAPNRAAATAYAVRHGIA